MMCYDADKKYNSRQNGTNKFKFIFQQYVKLNISNISVLILFDIYSSVCVTNTNTTKKELNNKSVLCVLTKNFLQNPNSVY